MFSTTIDSVNIQKRVLGKYLSFALVTALILGLFPVFSWANRAAAEDETQRIDFSLTTAANYADPSVPVKKEYWSGENIAPYAVFEASGTNVNIPDATLTLKVPKSPFIDKPSFIDSDAATKTTMREDADAWYVDYYFKTLKGGMDGGYAFPFKFKNGVTPDGTTVTPTWTLTVPGSDGNTKVLKETSITFTARAGVKYSPAKGVRWYDGYYNAGTIGAAKNVQAKDIQVDDLSTDVTTGAAGQVHRYCVALNVGSVAGAPDGLGKLNPSTFRIVDTIPEYAEPHPSMLSAGWVWDPTARTVTLEAPISKLWAGNNQCIHGFGTWYDLVFKNAPFREGGDATGDLKVYTNRAVITADPGLPTEQVLSEVSANVAFKPVEKPKFAKTHSYRFDKTYGWDRREYSYFDSRLISNDKRAEVSLESDPQDPTYLNSLAWAINITQTNNGSSFENSSTGGIHDYLKTVRDVELDSRLRYTGFQFRSISRESNATLSAEQIKARVNSIDNVLYGVKADGTKVELARNLRVGDSTIKIEDPQGLYRSLSFEFATPVELDNYTLNLAVFSTLMADDAQKWQKGEYTQTQSYYNWSETDWTNGDTQEEVTSRKNSERYQHNNYINISPINPNVQIWAGSNQTVAYVKCEAKLPEGTPLTPHNCARVRAYDFDLRPGWGSRWAGFNEPLKNYRQIVVLPQGVNYLRTVHTKVDGESPAREKIEPQIVHNWKNTGKTALIYSYGDVDTRNGDYGARIWERVELDTTINAEPGNNRVETYSVWDNNDQIKAANGSGSWVDSLDLDGDGDKTERFLKAGLDITFIPPSELVVKKQVSLDGSSWFLNAPSQDLGGDVFYRYSLRNSSIRAINSVSVIDVLPHGSDHKIAANEAGVYLPRTWEKAGEDGSLSVVEHSAFVTPLTEALETVKDSSGNLVNEAVLRKYDVFYSLTPQGDDLESVRDSRWLRADEITDFTQVKSIKVVLKQGELLNPSEVVYFVAKHKLPFTEATRALDNDSRAVNSVAVSRNDVNYIEANEVTSQNIKYSLEGVVFKDLNRDGSLRADEDRLAGYTVELVNADGSPATDPDGNPVASTVTDANGHYTFTVYKRGDYKVRFTKAATEEFTVLGTGKDQVINHTTGVSETLGESTVVRLDPETPHGIRNAGLVGAKRDVKLAKVDQDGAPVPGVGFELRWVGPLDGQGAPDPVPTTFAGTSDAQGNVTFANVPFGKYQLHETVVPTGITGLTSPLDLVINGEPYALDAEGNPLAALPITNTVVKASVKVVKVDADDHDVKLAGAQFVLKNASGQVVYGPVTTDADGAAVFENVVYGDYTLAETTAAEHYNLSDETRKVQVRNADHGTTIALPVFENSIFKGSVTARKLDADTGAPIQGARFGLFEKNTGDGTVATAASYTATSRADGTVPFREVRFGTYVLKEIQPAAGYLANTAFAQDVTINAQGQVVNVGDISNTIFKGTVKVTKLDFDDQTKVLAGVSFALFAKNADGTVAATASYSATTGADGVATFTGVRYGSYILRETATLPGYELATATQDVAISENGQEVVAQPVTNRLIVGTVKAKKLETGTNTPLQGVAFGLFAVNADGTVASAASFTATSGADGTVVFDRVTKGSWKLREITPLASHVANTTDVRDVTITTRDQVVDLTGNAFMNNVKRSDVTVKKVETGTTTPIPGTVFSLFPVGSDGTVAAAPAYTATTGNDGVATFSQVRYGQYKLRETQPAQGFNPSSEVNGRDIAVSENNVTVDTTSTPFENDPITSTVTVRKTDSRDNTQVLAGVTFGLFKKQADGTYADTAAYTATSGADGMVSFGGVRFGEYQLRETATLANYNLSSETRVVNVTTQGATIALGDFTNKIITGSVTLTKVDADNNQVAVPGARFALKQNGAVKYEAEADASGLVAFSNVVYGQYTLVETSAPDNYVLDTNWSQEVTVNKQDQIISVGKVTNRLKKATVNVTKLDGDNTDSNGDPAKLAGAVFGLYQADQLKYEATSGADGIARFTDVIYGDYVLKEITPPTGYTLNTSTALDVSVRVDGSTINAGSLTNTLNRGDITVTKTSRLGLPLQGGVFELRTLNDEVVATATSGQDGVARFANIKYGNYQIVETQAPEGYLLDGTPVTVSIIDHGVTVDAGIVTNERIIGAIAGVKVDQRDTTRGLEGAVFELRQLSTQQEQGTTPGGDATPTPTPTASASATATASAGATATAAPTATASPTEDSVVKVDPAKVKGGALVATATSNKKGQVLFENVEYGDYLLVEAKAPEGYLVDSMPRIIRVREHGVTVEAGMIENARIHGAVSIQKTNPDGVPLAGAVFELRDSQGKVLANATTDATGKAVFDTVEYGDYTLVETRAPEGYILESNEKKVQVREDKVTVQAGTVINKPVPAKLAHTGANSPLALTITLLGLGGLALAIGKWRRKAQS